MRLEERFIESASTVSIRDRIRLGAKIPLPKLKDLNLVGFNELFINLNDCEIGPQAGIDQNWIYAGIEQQYKSWIWLPLEHS